MGAPSGYWPSAWPGEDGGPSRRQQPHGTNGPALRPGERIEVVHREAVAATMLVHRDPGELYLLAHTGGDRAVSRVERIDPVGLETIDRSPDLPGGPVWPGGIAVHANGDLYVVFGNHAHRLGPDCTLRVSRQLPRPIAYNSFVVLADGTLVAKDFAKDSGPSELLALEPDGLEIVARCPLPERSIARLSAEDTDIYVVGDTSLLRVRWTGTDLVLDAGAFPPYRTLEGQTYGWDAVIDAGAAWFLDNGEGSERYAGTFRGKGVSEAPLHLVRVDLVTGAVSLAEVCGAPGGLVANPPAIDPERGIAVGFDSANRAVVGFDIGPDGGLTLRWRRTQDHAAHMLRFADTGELVTMDHDADRFADQVVVLDIETGDERGRADTGSQVQSVLFPAPGFGRDFYVVSFTTVSRVSVA